MNATCPTQKELRSLSLGQLPEEQSDELILHLRECESCQTEMETLDESGDTFVQQLKSVSSETPNEFLSEDDCRVASARALAALANAETDGTLGRIPKMIGEYEIIRPIGRGGMGQVYLGRHTKLGRQVAVKVIANHRRWDERTQNRFASEMKNIGGLNHPNIVAAHDAREVDGLAVLVTEFVDGMDVSEIVKRNGQLSVADACKITEAVCKALEYIDEQGLVHRDIKPSNIMIDKLGTVKLLDLGLARLQSVQPDGVGEFTATGQAVGTADYVSPEQINQDPNLDTRTDIYGLGCTLYKLLSGSAPFVGPEYPTAFAKMNAHVDQVPASIGHHRNDLPKGMVKLVDQMLLKKPDQRPQSAKEVAERIEKIHGKLSSKGDLKTLVQESLVKPAVADQSSHKASTNKVPSKTALKETSPGFFNRNPWAAAIAAGAAALVLGIWFGITITVKKPDGTISKIVVPDGSSVVIDAAGNVDVQLADGKGSFHIDKANVEDKRPGIGNTSDESSAGRIALSDFADSIARDPRQLGIKGARESRNAFAPLENEPTDSQASPEKGYNLVWTIKPDSPLFGALSPGDRLDFVGVPKKITSKIATDDSWPKVVLEYVKVLKTNLANPHPRGNPDTVDSQWIQLELLGKDIHAAVDAAERELAAIDPGTDGIQLELMFHHQDRKLIPLYSRLQGLWRTVLVTRTDRKEPDPELKKFLHVLHHNRFGVFPGTVNQFVDTEFEIGWTSDNQIRLIDPSRGEMEEMEGQFTIIKFLDEDIFEMTYGPETLRLQRVRTPKTPNEKEIFQMMEDRKFEKKFSIQIATPDKVDDFGDDQKAVTIKNGADSKEYWVGPSFITNKDLVSAKAVKSEGGDWGIQFKLSPLAGQKMAYMTTRYRGESLRIEVEGGSITMPKIVETVYRSGLINLAGLSEEKAKRIAQEIQSSSKPKEEKTEPDGT